MTKEEMKAAQRKALMDAGLTEEQADKAMGVYGGAVEYVCFQQVIGERDKSITALQEQLKGNEGAATTLKAVQDALKQRDGELALARKQGAIRLEIAKAKARNEKAVCALLDEAKISLEDDGTLKGLSEQLEALKKSDAYLFGDGSAAEPNQPKPQSGGSPPRVRGK